MMNKKLHAIRDLPDEVQRQLIRCEGFIDLKMSSRAEQELAAIVSSFQDHFYYRWLKTSLLMLQGKWPEAQPLAAELRREFPREAGFWIQDAYVTRRNRNIESAQAILEEALLHFPQEAILYFNLACYACRMGNKTEAMQRLKSAIELDEKWIPAALADEDLVELHEDVENWL